MVILVITEKNEVDFNNDAFKGTVFLKTNLQSYSTVLYIKSISDVSGENVQLTAYTMVVTTVEKKIKDTSDTSSDICLIHKRRKYLQIVLHCRPV